MEYLNIFFITERITPRLVTINEGKNLKLTCYSFTPARWIADKGAFLQNTKTCKEESRITGYRYDYVLEFEHVTLANAGQYICVGESNTEEDFKEYAMVMVTGNYNSNN